MLHGAHDFRVDRVDIGGKVGEEAVLGDPGEALRVDIDIPQRRGRRSLLQQRADRLALVKAEARDLYEADDVRCVGAQGGDHLTSVGLGDENRRVVLATEHVGDPRDVICKRGLPAAEAR
jgi:hypothetical protein